MPQFRRIVLAALVLLSTGFTTTAQIGAHDLPNIPGIGTRPIAADEKMKVPEYIKPGFEMTFMGVGSTETEDGLKSGMGFTVYTVLAVLKDKVLISASNYLTPHGMELNADGSFDYDSDSRAQLSDSSSIMMSKSDVAAGEALWMPIEQLKEWKPSEKIEVVPKSWTAGWPE